MHEDVEIQKLIQPCSKNKLQFQIYHSGFVQDFPAVYIEKWIKNFDIETLNSNRLC